MEFHPPVAPERLAGWSELREQVTPWIGERATALFAYAISAASSSHRCAEYFREQLVDAGDDPENPQVTEAERLLIDWGRCIAQGPDVVPADIQTRVERTFSPERRQTLLAFAEQTVAGNAA